MSKPEGISPDLIDAADKILSDAWKAHDADFNPHSNSISDGLWGKFVNATASAILAEREACALIADQHMNHGPLDAAAAIRKRGEVNTAHKLKTEA